MPRFVQGVEVNKEIPVNAEIKVGHFYRKNSYGDTDVFRRLTYWRQFPPKRNTESLKARLTG